MRKSVVFELVLATMFLLGTSNAGAGNGPIDYCLDIDCSCSSSCERLTWDAAVTNECGVNITEPSCAAGYAEIDGIGITSSYYWPPGAVGIGSWTFDFEPGEYLTAFMCEAETEAGEPVASGWVVCDICTVPPCEEVDIRPLSCPNPMNINGKGVLPVAILGTEDFDVTTIDPATVRLEGVAPLRWSEHDVATPFNGPLVENCYDCTEEESDGFIDLTLKFDHQEVVAAIGSVSGDDCVRVHMTGNLKAEYGGTPIEGFDMMWVTPNVDGD